MDKKDWRNDGEPGEATPISAEAIEDLEDRAEAAIDAAAAGGIRKLYRPSTVDHVSSSTWIDIPGMSGTITVGVRPILFRFWCSGATNNTAGNGVTVRVIDQDDVQWANAAIFFPDAGAVTTMSIFQPASPDPGDYTFRVQSAPVFVGTVTIQHPFNFSIIEE